MTVSLAGQRVSFDANIYAAKAGDVLVTQRPGRLSHNQKITRDVIVVEIALSENSELARVAKLLSGRTVGAQLTLRDPVCQRRTQLGGPWDGAQVYEVCPAGIEGVAVGHTGEEALLTCI